MTTGGLSPVDFWTWWQGAPRAGSAPGYGTIGPALPGELDLAARAARLRSQIPPGVLEELGLVERTRLIRALEQLEELQSGTRFQSGGFTAQQRIRNLQSSIGRILGEAERDLMARRLASQEAQLYIRQFNARQAALQARRPFLGLGLGGAVTLGGVLLIIFVGLILNQQQLDVLNRARALADSPNPESVFIGPAASGPCAEEAMLQNGLIWTEQGWRAPQLNPEPMLHPPESEGGFGGDEERYRSELEDWEAEMGAAVTAALAEAQGRCGTVTPQGCTEVVSRAVVWKQDIDGPESYRILRSEGRLAASVWQWETGRFGDDTDRDLLVARLVGEPEAPVCVGYRFIDFEEAQQLVAEAGADEETQHWVNTGCYWGIGIENENGQRDSDADYENLLTGQLGTDGRAALMFGEIACGIGLPATTVLQLEISTASGASLARG